MNLRLMLPLALLMLMASALVADTSTMYSLSGFSVVRTLAVERAGAINYATDAASDAYESTITLEVINRGPLARQGIILEESLAYLPAHARLSYSIQPRGEGRSAVWSVGDLAPGQSFKVSFSLPGAVPDGVVKDADAPKVSFDKASARLDAPLAADVGTPATLVLRSPSGQPIAEAMVEITGPRGDRQVEYTDAQGRAQFIPQSVGYYTFIVPDYEIGALKSTQTREPAALAAPAPQTPGKSGVAQQTPADSGKGGDLLALLPWAIGLVVIAAIGLALYSMMGGREEREDGEGTARAERSAADDFDRGVAIVPPASRPRAAGMGDPAPSSSAMGSDSAPSSAGSAPSAGLDADVQAQTRGLLSARRATAQPPQAPEPPKAPRPEERAFEQSETAAALGAAEATRIDEADEDEEDTEPEVGAPLPPRVSGPSAPAWMAGQAGEGERSEEDDEAIAKAIEELEQLRAELKARSSGAAAAGRADDESRASAEGAEASEEDEEPAPEEEGEEEPSEAEDAAPAEGEESPVGSPQPMAPEAVVVEEEEPALLEEAPMDEPAPRKRGRPPKASRAKAAAAKRPVGRPRANTPAPAARGRPAAKAGARAKTPAKAPGRRGPGRPPKAAQGKKR